MGKASHAVLQVEAVAPRAVRLAAIFAATVSGDPTYSAPCGPTSCTKDSLVGTAKPRVLLYRVMTSW